MKDRIGIQIMTLLVLLVLSLNCAAQQQKSLAKFIVTHAVNNKVDITEWAVESGISTVFYEVDDELYMANYSEDTDEQSWGRVWGFTNQTQEETETEYKADIFRFNWSYKNTYDDKVGACKVEFIKIYKPQGVVSVLRMITESLDVIEYTGYMEGSIDFSSY
ncbi:MAG: hypothetical protein IJV42_04690 [Bacteroidaceae bacterium]|nr:hypothetical protein [Bacteroidaceae bacterium]